MNMNILNISVSEHYTQMSVVPCRKQSANTKCANRFMTFRQTIGIFLKIIYNSHYVENMRRFVMLNVVYI
jgi:ABC-type thiamine transport system substrate-binding protein